METIESKESKMITTIHQALELSSSFLVSCNEIAGEVLLVLIIEFVDEPPDVDSTSVLEIPDGVMGSSAMMGPPVEGGRLGSKDGESDTADVVSGRLVEVVSEKLVVKLDSLVVSSGLVLPVEDPVVSASFVVSSDGRRQIGALESSNNVHTPPFVQSFSQLFPS